MQSRAFIIIIVIVISMAVAVTVAVVILCQMQTRTNSSAPIRAWLNNTVDRAGMNSSALSQCDNAPFVLPSSGFVGLLYGDTAGPYNILRRHTGIDIFGDGVPGTIPVYAAYNGWLSRHSNWISTVAIRHDDPLADRVIYTYYTHMASRDGQTSFILRQFAPGISEVPVRQGDLIGYQGEYSGQARPVAMHLHFSIVLADAGSGILNEARLQNTLDPSPYLGLSVNIASLPDRPIRCNESSALQP